MKYLLFIVLFLVGFSHRTVGQSKAELEERRSKTLSEIAYVDNLLKSTTIKKNESMNAIKIIGNKLILREMVINGMGEEISLITVRINLNTTAINMMERDLINLREDYSRAVVNSYRAKKGSPDIIYILSAKDFNQGYKRLKYLKQVTKFRRKEAETILELKSQIQTTKDKLQGDLFKISDLKSREEQQKELLQREQEKKQSMVKSLTNKEKQLKADLEEKKRIAAKIENEIARIIEEERKRSIKSDNTPEQRLIGENFVENKGKLPWPVEKGIITSRFGVHKHPVLKYLTEDNIGIEITSSGKISARTVFQGEVVKVFAIPGANMTIIVRHGKYLSVYANIVNVRVKPGDKVFTKQVIGEVYSDPSDNDNSILKFMIFETNQKYQDPELWITKN
jgi:septal ring factor EnvC (AmiA/AmiB activator)